MKIKEEQRDNVKIIALRGKLDAQTSPGVENRLMELTGLSKQELVFDFAELTFISSCGLRLLLKVAKNVQKANGKLALAGLRDNIREVFEIAGLASIFSIFPTCDDAIAYVQGGTRCEDKTLIPPGSAVGH